MKIFILVVYLLFNILEISHTKGVHHNKGNHHHHHGRTAQVKHVVTHHNNKVERVAIEDELKGLHPNKINLGHSSKAKDNTVESSAEKREKNGCPEPFDVIKVEDIKDAARASSLAYDENVLAVGATVPHTGYKVTFVKEEKLFDGHAGFLVFVAEKGDTTMVTFRGTDSDKQLQAQIYSTIKDMDGKEWKILNTEVNINEFFLNAVKLLLPSIEYMLKDRSRRYILTGHSLGGALASITAIMNVEKGGDVWANPRSSLITFGAPRVGSKEYALLHDLHIHTYRKLRFINRRDMVPHIPLWPWYLHHSREVLLDYDNGGWFSSRKKNYWRVCNLQEQLMCSNYYTLAPSTADHSMDEYIKKITQEPSYYKQRDSKIVSTFEASLINSCLLTEKRTLGEDSMQDVEMRRMYTKRMANKTMLSSSEAMEKLRKIHEDFKPTNVN